LCGWRSLWHQKMAMPPRYWRRVIGDFLLYFG